MFSLNEWFPKTKAVLDSVQADIVLACLLLNSTQVLAELGSAQLGLVFQYCHLRRGGYNKTVVFESKIQKKEFSFFQPYRGKKFH